MNLKDRAIREAADRAVAKLTARDFVYVNDDVFGPSYQNGPYVIIVGSRSYYAASYQGRTIAYNLRDFLSAVEVCAKHDAARRGYEIEIVYSGAPGWFDFYINGKPWGCARANTVAQRVREVIELKESRKNGGAL